MRIVSASLRLLSPAHSAQIRRDRNSSVAFPWRSPGNRTGLRGRRRRGNSQRPSARRDRRRSPLPASAEVLLFAHEMSNWRSDFGGGQDRRRDLIEQRLEDVVVALVDKNNVDFSSPESTRRGDPREAAAKNHNTLSRVGIIRGLWRSCLLGQRKIFRGPCSNILQCTAHCLASSWRAPLVETCRANALAPPSS